MYQKGVAHILLLIVLLAGLIAGVYLVSSGNPLKLFSKASEVKEVLQVVKPANQNVGYVVGRAEKDYGKKFINAEGTTTVLKTSNKINKGSVDGSLKGLIQTNVESASAKGFIIEFKDESLIQAQLRVEQAEGKPTSKSFIQSYQSTLKSAHEQAKQDIFSKIGKKAVPANKSFIASTSDKVVILGDYTEVYNGVALDISPQEAEKIKKSPFVKGVHPNLVIKAQLINSVPAIYADKVWNLRDDRKAEIRGAGVTVAVIDTGIDYTHPDLGGCLGGNCKVMGGFDFVNWDSDPMDDSGHGTHVAGIIAGEGLLSDGRALTGVSPGVKLIAYKVLGGNGSGYISSIISAIERSADPNQDGDFSDHVGVINMSLGAQCYTYNDDCGPNDPSSQVVNYVSNIGVTVVIAAGNSGPDLGTINSPGTALGAITVGATFAADNNVTMADFSSRGPIVLKNPDGSQEFFAKPDVVAPGVHICAAEWDNWLSDYRCLQSKANHIDISGTSMAAPHVAGVVALMKQAHPGWTNYQIRSVVKNTTGKNITSGVNAQGGGGGGGGSGSIVDRGAGMVNALSAVKISGRPPFAQLFSLISQNGSILIRGVAANDNLKSWSLSYAPADMYLDSNKWIDITPGKLSVNTINLTTISTQTIPDGEYAVRLLVEDKDGQKGADYGYFKVEKLKFKSPLGSDILRAGDNIPVQLNIEGNIFPEEFILEYIPSSGSGKWIEGGRGKDKIINWNTKGLSTGDYTLRVTMNHDGIQDQKMISVYLDTTLKVGWPQKISWEPDPDGGFLWGGYFEPVVADLLGDSKKEIVVYGAGDPPKLYVYRSDGSLLWQASVGSSAAPGGNLHIPLVVDINNDGNKEVFAYNYSSKQSGYSELYGFDTQGKILPGWPIKMPKNWIVTMLAADIFQDGKKEIIIQGHNSSFGSANKMIIIQGDGKIISQWDLSTSTWSASTTGTPAVGNFDSEKDLEIVVARPSAKAGWHDGEMNNDGEVHIFKWNGSELSGWPIKTPGVIFSSPVVGDINKDGKNEIVVGLMYSSITFPEPSLGGLYAFNAQGKILPGWPVEKGYNFWSSPSLGDLNNDGFLEIAASRLGFSTEVFRYDGRLMPGWPQQTNWHDYYSTIMASVYSNNESNILTTAGGEVFAWDVSGHIVTGFPKQTEVDAQAPATVADLDNDGKLEIVASSDDDFDWATNTYKRRGSIYVWEMPVRFNLGTSPWTTFHHDELRTGMYPSVLTIPSLPAFSCTACLADVNKDKNVNISDISLWSYCRVRGINSSPRCSNADITKECLISQFGKKCLN